MITVGDMLELECLADAEALVDVAGARARSVSDVAVMDAEPLVGAYDTFLPHEAVFTSLGFSGGVAAAADEALERLIDRGVAAVFVKAPFAYEPSAKLAARAARAGIPLYRYREGYLEAVIAAARGLIADAQEGAHEREAVEALLALRNPKAVRAAADAAGLPPASYVQALAVAAESTGAMALRALRSEVRATAPEGEAVCLRYGDALLVLRALADVRGNAGATFAKRLSGALRGHGRCGASEILPQADADLAVREALAALEGARRRDLPFLNWNDLGPDAFAAAVPTSPLLERARCANVGKLQTYDRSCGGDLALSMETYVACGGDVNAAAAALHQHPNSLRNRLRRTREVLDVEALGDREFFAFLAMMFL